MIDSCSAQRKIFISYKHKVEPDQSVVDRVVGALELQRHTVFIDKKIMPGDEWGKWIRERITESDFLITFLTAQSVLSQMVQEEVQLARELAQSQGRPKVIPVRLAYDEELPYPLGKYLNHIQWAEWESEADTQRLITQLTQAVFGQSFASGQSQPKEASAQSGQPDAVPPPTPSAQPRSLDPTKLDSPEGTIDPQSAFYVVRSSDSVALDAIQRQGVTITIKGPRQMGKSSLLMRLIQAAINSGRQVAFLDFQLFDRTALYEADTFFRQFCAWLTEELDMENRVEDHWHRSGGGNILRCTRYVGRYLLPSLTHPLTLAMDEVESIFDTPFRSDFFSMLRSWHNYRATNPLWKQLDLLLVTSTEPYQLIADLNQSPFNVGEVIELTDFTPEQVHDLNRRHGSPFLPAEEQQLTELLHGQPYLVRRALYLVATQRLSVAELFTRASEDRGPFGDHLRYHLFRLHNNKHLIQGLQQVISAQTCADEDVFFRLHGAGLVRRVGRMVLPRCPLYAAYFGERLDG